MVAGTLAIWKSCVDAVQSDGLEAVVADDLWPLPTFQEILFIK